MRMLLLNKQNWVAIILALLLSIVSTSLYAEPVNGGSVSIDRIQLVTEQINLLKNRLAQAQIELDNLSKQQEDQFSQPVLEKASKSLLDKASLDISVAKSNLDSINIELADSQQISSWLEKNITEIENQLNVLNIFGLKMAPTERDNIQEYRTDLRYQQKLLLLEKSRIKYLQQLQNVASSILAQRNGRYTNLNELLKNRKMLHIKQQQIKDEDGGCHQ